MNEPLAIVGLGLRLPGDICAPAQWWPNLTARRNLVGTPPPDRPTPGDPAQPAGWLTAVDRFDAAFFGMKGLEACYTDPAQRLLLEVVWEAFEEGGFDVSQLRGSRTGVFVGAHTSDYQELAVRAGAEVNAYWNGGMNTAVLANRLSYFFDFHGPSLTINTACSSSLEALCQAALSLWSGRCQQAVVAGVNLILSESVGQGAFRAGMLSPDGRCKTFDAAANGFVRGEGVVALLLKKADRAEQDGDKIWALLQSALSCHGGHASSFTAPNLKFQRQLLEEAWASINVGNLGYVEAHGTGTRLGDSVEVEALKEAFAARLGNREQPFCGLGSVKTQIGHLEAAAGLAGVAKMCLALRHAVKPGLTHFERCSPLIDLTQTPLYPQAETAPWPKPADGGARLAGVSGFGFGGAYAHVVLAEPPIAQALSESEGPHLLLLSARDETRLLAMTARLLQYLQDSEAPLAAVAHGLRQGRQAMVARLALVVNHRDEALTRLGMLAAGQWPDFCWRGTAAKKRRRQAPPLMPPPGSELAQLAQAWVAGASCRWNGYFPPQPKLALPTYPFAEGRYWFN